jgi:hypothetical protein
MRGKRVEIAGGNEERERRIRELIGFVVLL